MYKNARREELEQTGEQGVNEQDLLNEENLLKDPRLIDMDEVLVTFIVLERLR